MRKPTASARKSASRARAARQSAPKTRSKATARRGKATAREQRRGARRHSGEGAAAPRRAERAERRRVREDRPAADASPVGAEPAAGASRGKYVYCIIEARDPLRFGPIGIGADPSEVYTVHYKNLAAVVSDAPLEVLDSTRENVLAHERVNETVMREHTVIPMSFGTIFKTREDIVELLRSAAEAFGDVLNKMQNKLEFGLKVLWDRDQAVREVESEDEDISRLKKEISGQKGPTYFARMQYGRLVDAALQARSERYVADILDELRDVSVASRINKPIGDKMIMNAAFLISRDQETGVRRQGEVDREPLRQADVQVHGPVAAVQLREHPAEAGKGVAQAEASAISPDLSHAMFILDSLLVGSLRFVLDKVVAAAEAEAQDDSALREQLLEAQMQLELGEISEEEFAEIERDVLARIREIKGPQQGALTMSPHDRITGVDVESFEAEG